jgi:hypothetical protein
MSEKIYDELVSGGLQTLCLPAIQGVLISAWGAKTKRIKNQALILFEVGRSEFEQVFMIAGQLTIDAILGANFLCVYEVTMNFRDKCFTALQNGAMNRHSFAIN